MDTLVQRIEKRVDVFRSIMNDTGITEETIRWLIEKGFFNAPASTKHHGDYEGGLFEHSLETAKSLVLLTENNKLKWQNPRSPKIVGMLHDVTKMDEYYYEPVYDGHPDPSSCGWKWNKETMLKGHGDKSIMLLSTQLVLTEEEMMCIRYHMGAYTDKEQWNDYGRAVEKFSNVLWTHHADMIASKIIGV